MNRMRCYFVILVILILFFPFKIFAQKSDDRGRPPATVVVSYVEIGTLAPQQEFVGTVYYHEVSDVASEVDGKVEVVNFEEGQRIKKSDVLVKLSSDLLEKTLQATKASHEEVLSELENASRNLKRIEELYREELVSEKTYDEVKFGVKALKKRAESLKAEVERLKLELSKKLVKAPFDGVVLKRYIDRGEWLSPGAPILSLAKDDIVDIIVDIPEEVIKNVKPEMRVHINAGGKELTGKVFQVIPTGDISTRVFPVKIRLKNNISLVEGMEARVSLPIGPKRKAFIVSRDALITKFGSTVIFTVVDSKARMLPVKVVGYMGKKVGIESPALKDGAEVVIKGNERLMNGQPVMVINRVDTKS